MANKLTQRDFFNAIIDMMNNVDTDITALEVIDFCEGRIAQLDKKNANRKPAASKVAKANAETADAVFDFIVENPGATVADIRDEFSLSSSQKAAAIVKILVDAHRVSADTVKKVRHFSAVADEDVD